MISCNCTPTVNDAPNRYGMDHSVRTDLLADVQQEEREIGTHLLVMDLGHTGIDKHSAGTRSRTTVHNNTLCNGIRSLEQVDVGRFEAVGHESGIADHRLLNVGEGLRMRANEIAQLLHSLHLLLPFRTGGDHFIASGKIWIRLLQLEFTPPFQSYLLHTIILCIRGCGIHT